MKKQTRKQQTFERVALALVQANELPTASRFAQWAGLPAIPKADKKPAKPAAWRAVAVALAEAFALPGTIETDEWNALIETSLQAGSVLAESLPMDKAEVARLKGFIDATAPKRRKA
ncbi:MAG: hypothetical protein HOP19_07530 [Acidobacteria bacterium]|nr:hypothetical protein [Acidobacteriota bacterium]